jgi:hypothetical protein
VGLGLAADSGFHGLLTSVHRRLASIERHLGLAPGDGTEELDEPPSAAH